jgi:RHS repeat-associated protein
VPDVCGAHELIEWWTANAFNGDGDVDEGSQYVYDGDDIVLAFDQDGSLTNRYLHGPAVDHILADEQYGGDSSHDDPSSETGNVYWPLVDNLGSVRQLVNSSGSVVNHIQYDAFGRITAEKDGSGNVHKHGDASYIDHIYGFTSRERDYESHLQYNRARYYDAAIGRWLSEDPVGFAAGDANLSRYVGNGPTNATDPSGKLWGKWSDLQANGAHLFAERLGALALAETKIGDRELMGKRLKDGRLQMIGPRQQVLLLFALGVKFLELKIKLARLELRWVKVAIEKDLCDSRLSQIEQEETRVRSAIFKLSLRADLIKAEIIRRFGVVPAIIVFVDVGGGKFEKKPVDPFEEGPEHLGNPANRIDPPPHADQQAGGDPWADRLQFGLGLLGMLPGPVGMAANAANGLIAAGRGDFGGAALNFGMMAASAVGAAVVIRGASIAGRGASASRTALLSITPRSAAARSQYLRSDPRHG